MTTGAPVDQIPDEANATQVARPPGRTGTIDTEIRTGSPVGASTSAGPKGAKPLAVEGFFQSLAQGLGETYLGAAMVWLGAGGLVLGLVGALPTAATALSQVVAARMAGGVHGARAFIARSWLLQALALALLGGLALLRAPFAIPLVFGGAVLSWFAAGLSVPSWTGLVSRVVPRERNGWFFGLRGAVQQVGVVSAILGGGAILSLAEREGRVGLGFVVVFGLAGLFRAIGSGFLLAVPERGRPRRGTPLRAIGTVLRGSRKFRRLAIYLWAFHFAAWVAAPFFLPYMLRELRFSYGQVGLLVAVPAIVKSMTMRRWGTLADRIGPGPLLRGIGWFVLPVSSLWLISGEFWWIALAQFYAGLAWGGFELAQASALLQTTRGREDTVAFFNLVDGSAMILGSVVGGLTVTFAGRYLGVGFLAAIAASTVLRALVNLSLLRRVRRIGRPEWSHRAIPLRLWGVRASRGATFRPWGGLPPAADE
ncbi:MAG TPA: hypothetical protein VD788_03435 [Candidatus Polarisedimenticolaceae bacterium]|nr:hypothetical protein [Candidatus Polarisedimenticolaceae bacterium]